MQKWASRSVWISLAWLSAGFAIYAYRYLIGVGPLATNVLQNLFARPWLLVHVAGAATALLLGSLQLLPRFRPGRVHRYIGRVYVFACLVGGTGGLFLAFGSTAGPVATAGFGSLGVLWIVITSLGWRNARARRFDAHRGWMIRSYALTFAAVTLRIYLMLVPLLGLPMLASYRAISFLCWVPNLLVAEIYLAMTARRVAACNYGSVRAE
jgi:uncharacterized membrane protein